MEQMTIQAQVDIIKNATKIASQSKEAALKFLSDAGIIKCENNNNNIKNNSTEKIRN